MRHTMSAAGAVALIEEFERRGADVCIGGGWGVDANVGRQTRDHGDLDIWVRADQFDLVVVALSAAGVDRLYPWGGDRPWNFVLHDDANRRVDLHVFEPDGPDSVHYGGYRGESFPAAALAGRGSINGRPVRCEAPAWSLRWHTGYATRDVDRHDVSVLCAHFAFDLPAGFE